MVQKVDNTNIGTVSNNDFNKTITCLDINFQKPFFRTDLHTVDVLDIELGN